MRDTGTLLDREGFLRHRDEWNPDVAKMIATSCGVQLTEQHWEILHLVRDYYQQFDHSPAMRPLVKFIRQNLGESQANSVYLLSLFPDSPAKLASQIAGLPKPDNCL